MLPSLSSPPQYTHTHIQINIQSDLVHMILDNVSKGRISRGLFHEAALNIFSVLILYWKRWTTLTHSITIVTMVDTSSSSTLRFCVERFAPRRKHSIDSSNNRRNHSPTSSPSKSPTRTSHRKKSLSIHHSQLFGKFVNYIYTLLPLSLYHNCFHTA